MMAALQMLMTRGSIFRGNRSSITVWDKGMRDAPASPWMMRKMTISGRLVASPHSIEATVKPPMDRMNIRLRPIFSEIQPDRGIMIAVAMM